MRIQFLLATILFIMLFQVNADESEDFALTSKSLATTVNRSMRSKVHRRSSHFHFRRLQLDSGRSVASASSSYAFHTPSKAIDGDPVTFWQLAVGFNMEEYEQLAEGSWFQLDLLNEYEVSRVDVVRGRDVRVGENIWAWQVVQLGLTDRPMIVVTEELSTIEEEDDEDKEEVEEDDLSNPEYTFECDLGSLRWEARKMQVVRSECSKGAKGRYLVFKKEMVQCSVKRMAWDIAELRVYARRVTSRQQQLLQQPIFTNSSNGTNESKFDNGSNLAVAESLEMEEEAVVAATAGAAEGSRTHADSASSASLVISVTLGMAVAKLLWRDVFAL